VHPEKYFEDIFSRFIGEDKKWQQTSERR